MFPTHLNPCCRTPARGAVGNLSQRAPPHGRFGLITATEYGADLKTLRKALKDAISSSKPLSVAVGIRSLKRKGEAYVPLA